MHMLNFIILEGGRYTMYVVHDDCRRIRSLTFTRSVHCMLPDNIYQKHIKLCLSPQYVHVMTAMGEWTKNQVSRMPYECPLDILAKWHAGCFRTQFLFLKKTKLLFSLNCHQAKQVNKTNARTSFGHCLNKISRLKLTEINTSWQV